MQAAESFERLGMCMGLRKITQLDRKGEVAPQSMYVTRTLMEM
jgi:hypothetical protein